MCNITQPHIDLLQSCYESHIKLIKCWTKWFVTGIFDVVSYRPSLVRKKAMVSFLNFFSSSCLEFFFPSKKLGPKECLSCWYLVFLVFHCPRLNHIESVQVWNFILKKPYVQVLLIQSKTSYLILSFRFFIFLILNTLRVCKCKALYISKCPMYVLSTKKVFEVVGTWVLGLPFSSA